MWGWDGGPPQTYLNEGLADSETGRFLGTGGAVLCPLGPWPFHCVQWDPICHKPQVVTGQRDTVIRALPSSAVSAQVPIPSFMPGFVGSQEGHQ